MIVELGCGVTIYPIWTEILHTCLTIDVTKKKNRKLDSDKEVLQFSESRTELTTSLGFRVLKPRLGLRCVSF